MLNGKNVIDFYKTKRYSQPMKCIIKDHQICPNEYGSCTGCKFWVTEKGNSPPKQRKLRPKRLFEIIKYRLQEHEYTQLIEYIDKLKLDTYRMGKADENKRRINKVS